MSEERNKLEEEYIEKIKAGSLTEKELSKLVSYFEIERQYGDNDRWTCPVSSIVKLCDKYYEVDWDEGLTECQDSYFYKLPYEVKLTEYEQTITVREWNKV